MAANKIYKFVRPLKAVRTAVTGLLFPLLVASCGWLDVTPSNAIDEKDLFSTGYGFRNSLNGIYLQLGSEALYGKNLSWGFLSAAAQEYLTDNSVQGANSTQLCKDAADFVYNSSTTESVVSDIWETSYSVISNINKIIEHIDGTPAGAFEYGEEERDLIKAEGHALRAMLHFDLLRLFAPAPATDPTGTYIPYRENFSSLPGTKLTVKEVITKALNDIAVAEPILRHFDTEYHTQAMYAYMMTSPTTQMSARYRFDSRLYIDDMGQFFWYRGWRLNYMALLALKARICLYGGSGYWPIAKTAAQEVYDSFYGGNAWVGFTPSENVVCQKDLRYTKLSDDVLFGTYKNTLATDFDSELFGSDNSVKYPLANIESLFASDNTGLYSDWRLDYILAKTNASNQAYYTLKYSVSSDTQVSAIENPMVPVIRFSEVCYILAELAAEDGNITKGIEYLETVRRARGAERSLSLSVSSADALKDEIVLDARKEFLCEGNMFYMYKRLNYSQIPSSSVPGTMKDASSAYVLPVPTSESPY